MMVNYVSSESNAGLLLQNEKAFPEQKNLQKNKKV
jgi:hypothetical protein